MKLIEHVFVVRVGKPVRCMLDRDEDMMSTGTRHPFLAKYKVLHLRNTRALCAGFILVSSAADFWDIINVFSQPGLCLSRGKYDCVLRGRHSVILLFLGWVHDKREDQSSRCKDVQQCWKFT